MSLDWSVSGVQDYKTVCMDDDGKGGQRLKGQVEAFIFATMFLGWPKKFKSWQLTEENFEEVYRRLFIYEEINGGGICDCWDDDGNRKPYRISKEELRSWIGLRTNGGTKTDTEFKKDCFRVLEDRMRDTVKG